MNGAIGAIKQTARSIIIVGSQDLKPQLGNE